MRPTDARPILPPMLALAVLLSTLLAMAMGVQGCSGPAAQRAEPPPPATTPEDFALAATVYRPGTARSVEPLLPVDLRPARYQLEPDLSLRASTGTGSDETTYPPIVRRLTPTQHERLWRAVVESGLLADDSSARVGSPEEHVTLEQRSTALITIRQGGQTRYASVGLDTGDPNGSEARRLVQRLARLAWIPEPPPRAAHGRFASGRSER